MMKSWFFFLNTIYLFVKFEIPVHDDTKIGGCGPLVMLYGGAALLLLTIKNLFVSIFLPLLLSRSWVAWCWACSQKISQNSSRQRCSWCGPNWWRRCTGTWPAPTPKWAGSRCPARRCEEEVRRCERGENAVRSLALQVVERRSTPLCVLVLSSTCCGVSTPRGISRTPNNVARSPLHF